MRKKEKEPQKTAEKEGSNKLPSFLINTYHMTGGFGKEYFMIYAFKKNTVHTFVKLEPADETGPVLPDLVSKEDVFLLQRILTAKTQEELADVPLDTLMKLYYLLGQKEVTDLFLKNNFLNTKENLSDLEHFYPKNKRRRLI